ncbi:MAG: glycosyltransferase family 4 protein [candidate division KSB1 bacterium]|nr:glycosyltransferase family 4 protein [candidate division KSB1 bacterium]
MSLKSTKEITILYYGSSLSIQKGADLCMFRLVKSFNDEKIQTLAILPGHGGIERKYAREGLKYYIIPSVPLRAKFSLKYQLSFLMSMIKEIKELRRIIRRENVDIIHVNDITFFAGLIAAKLEKRKTVCHVRFISIRYPIVKNVLVYLVTQLSDAIFCVSKAVQKHLFQSREKWRHASIFVVYDPTPDSIDFSIDDSNKDFRADLAISKRAFVVCNVSKFTRNKGQLVVAQAAAYLKKAGYNEDDFTFLLVGGAIENHRNYYETVRAFVSQHQLEKMVRFLGVREDVSWLFSNSDVAVHVPIHEDPFPGVVLEAMLCGKAVIGSKSGGIPEIIDDGKNGLLIPKNDPEALAERLIYLKSHPKVLQQLQQNAPDAIRRKFSFNDFKARHLEIYYSLKPELKPQKETYEIA